VKNFARSLYQGMVPLVLLCGCKGSTGSEPPGPPEGLRVVSAVPESVPVGTSVGDSVVVQVVDTNGRGVPSATVRWLVTAGFGRVSPSEVLSDRSGIARTAWTVGTRAGPQQLTASVLTATGSATQTISVAAVAGPAASVRISPSSFSLPAGNVRQLSVSVTDVHGNLITGRSAAWSSSNEAVASVDQTGSVTAKSAGSAEISARVDGVVGRATVMVNPALSGSRPALLFDGADDYVQVADAGSLDFGTGDFTWEVWLQRSRTNTREDVLAKKDVFADSEHDVVLLIESDGRANAFLRDSPGRSTVIVSSVSRIGTEWTHIAMTRSGGIVRLYVNGVLEGTGSAPFNVSSNGPFRIGANRVNNAGADAGPVFAFAGQVHEVRVWNVARSGQQIAEGLLQCFARGTAGLVGYYRFDEGSGNTVLDASGNGNNGILVNEPLWVTAPRRCPAT
jgi:hypothetical protein